MAQTVDATTTATTCAAQRFYFCVAKIKRERGHAKDGAKFQHTPTCVCVCGRGGDVVRAMASTAVGWRKYTQTHTHKRTHLSVLHGCGGQCNTTIR